MTTTELDLTEEEARQQQIEAIVRRVRALSAERKTISETIEALTSKLDELVEVGWKAEIDGVPAAKRAGNRTFGAELAIARMTEEQKLSCITTGINAKKVRAIADEMGWTEECMIEPDDKTRIVFS
jgi:hypothetical protein